jgi:signal transduction histidine kinase
MLDFARMEAGKLEFDLSKQNIVRLVSEAIDSLTPVAAKRGITFEISIPEEIRYVSADESLLNRVLLNLLENAIKFSPDNSEVFVNAQSLNNKIRVSITDSGEGIADDKIELIKTPFYQIDRSDTRPRPKGGLGLGLAIAQRILLGHGTELIIHSELGKGSTFSFDLIAVKNKE